MVHRLGEQLSEQLVVEDLEAAAAGDLADGGWVEAVLIVAVPALHEDAAVTHTLGIDLSPDVVQAQVLLNSRRNCSRCRQTLEKAMAPHSRTLAWRIPWTGEPGGLQSMGSRRVGHD